MGKDVLKRVIENIDFGKNSFLFLEGDEKFAKKLINAKKEYTNIVNDEETVYLLFDDTVWGSASKGFLLSSTSLYADAIDKNGIKLDDIKTFFVNTPIKRKIMIRGNDGLEKGHIHFNIRDDKDIPPYLDLLNKYLLILKMINSLIDNTSSEDDLIDAAFNTIATAEEGAADDQLITLFQNHFNAPQPQNCKTIYAQKIASGEIDPTEVGFAEFEKTYIKENMKKLYSEKIASGEIDPTEISFTEFADSMEPKVDMKKLYSEKIASGEIDPTEVSYAEFSGQGLTKENKPKATQKAESMTLEVIIENIKATYASHDDFDEMLNDLSEGNYLDHWANNFLTDDFNNNTELAKAIYEIKYTKCESSSDLASLASAINNNLNDPVWAKKILQEGYSKVSDLGEYNSLIEVINNSLEDNKWAKIVANEAIEKLNNADDIFEFSRDPENIITLAQFVASANGLNNQESAKKIFDLLKVCEGITDLLDAGRAVLEVYDRDDDYTQEFINVIIEKAMENVEDGYYSDIYFFLKNDLEDENRAESWKNDNFDELRSECEENENCEDIFGESSEITEIDTHATGYFKFEIINTGGQFAFGFITNEVSKKLLREKIDSEEICLENYGDDGLEVSIETFDKAVTLLYGPNGPEPKISITVYADEECENEIEVIIDNKEIDEQTLNTFTSLTPSISDHLDNIDLDALFFGGYYLEKRIHYPAIIKIEEDEKFDINNVYIGLVNMYQMLSENEIVNTVLYIRPHVAEEIMNIYEDGKYADDRLVSYIGGIYEGIENNTVNERILQLLTEAECPTLTIEGKGEREETFVVVRTLDGEVLFEGECSN